MGCSINGNIDDSSFSEPMPWIGLYVAVASAACVVAMAVDVFQGFRNRRYWFPCKFFSLNATTLTILTVATKLSVDLNTSMPSKQDQLAKLSSSVLICTAIGNFMPSLGTMEINEVLMNLMALGIFIVTVIVNICIQLRTGVIYVFYLEFVAVMCLMVFLLAILFSSSLTIPITKCYFDQEYSKKFKAAMRECNSRANNSVIKKLKVDLARFWIMAHTCSPQFVMGRLATCTASGAICLFSTIILLEAILRCYLMPWCFKFCNGGSDYKWSSTVILITQVAAIGIGSIGPASRWFNAINFRCPKRTFQAVQFDSKVENYWIRRLTQWKEYPFVLRFQNRHWKKMVQKSKDKVLDFCMLMQISIVLLCKLLRLISIYIMSRFLIAHRWYAKFMIVLKWKNSIPGQETESASPPGSPLSDLSFYVLHLEGEEKLIDVIMEKNCDTASHLMRMGRKKQPRHLLRLLEKLEPSREFEGVRTFDSVQVPSLDFDEPLNCFALPVVTLTGIAVALGQSDFPLVKELIRGVREGLCLIRDVEKNLDTSGNTADIRKAADIVWLEIELHYSWLDVDLQKLALLKINPKGILEGLAGIAKEKYIEFSAARVDNGCSSETPTNWPVEPLAANAMYRICQTLLLSPENGGSSRALVEKLSIMITDIIGACLTNLPFVISTQGHKRSIVKREKSVHEAILLLGKTENILEILDQQGRLSSHPDQLTSIDQWRLMCRSEDQVRSGSSSKNRDSGSSSSDLYLTIE